MYVCVGISLMLLPLQERELALKQAEVDCKEVDEIVKGQSKHHVIDRYRYVYIIYTCTLY